MRSSLLLIPLAVMACQADQVLLPEPGGAALPAPASLQTTTLDNAIELTWADNSYDADPGRFDHYQVWSSDYDLDNNLCLQPWSLEGTSVAPRFVAAALVNSAPRCFRVNALTTDGVASAYSPVRFDTPRYASSVIRLYAAQVDSDSAGFSFWHDLNQDLATSRDELGWVESERLGDIDLVLDRDAGGQLFLTPVRPGVGIALWPTIVADLTDIDVAPAAGYGRDPIAVLSGDGYVVEMPGPDGFKRYGAMRVVAVEPGSILFEWSFQGDPGSPELLRIR